MLPLPTTSVPKAQAEMFEYNNTNKLIARTIGASAGLALYFSGIRPVYWQKVSIAVIAALLVGVGIPLAARMVQRPKRPS
jgi:hypothetical protein